MTSKLPDDGAEQSINDEVKPSGHSGVDEKSAVTTPAATTKETPAGKRAKLTSLAATAKRRWRLTVPITLIVVVGLMLAVPASRYPLLGIFIKKNITVSVVDAKTQKPVTNAAVTLDGAKTLTDNKGQVKIRAKVGKKNISVTKKYYKDASAATLVAISQQKAPFKIQLQATGRQVPVAVINKVSGKPVANVLIKASGSEVKTDKDGKATIVLPADITTVSAVVQANNYNALKGTIRILEQVVSENTFALVPAGKIYFLSKLSGKVDVVKTNLDGTDRKVVLAGTGKEDNYDTVLLASRDWKYLALKSKREGGDNAKLFVIRAADDSIATIDEGNANFIPIGWSGNDFVYRVNRFDVELHKPKAQAFKSYDVERAKMATLDETEGEGTDARNAKYTRFDTAYLLGDRLIYSPAWTGRTDGYRVGPCTIRPHTNYYQELVQSIIGQQLSLQSAAAIEARFVALFEGKFPSPEQILAAPLEDLRAVGFSRAKAAYVCDLAEHVLAGKIELEKFDTLSNDNIIAELLPVKGIGEWTVHMFLMFCMGRLDVLPVGDLGIKNGVRQLYCFDVQPTAEDVREIALLNHWHPYETVASWYVWQSLRLGAKS